MECIVYEKKLTAFPESAESLEKMFFFGLEGICKERIDSGRIYQDQETFTDLMRVTGRVAYNPEHPMFASYAEWRRRESGPEADTVVIPSPATLYLDIMEQTDWNPEGVYPEPDRLPEDIVSAYRDTLRRLRDMGCRRLWLLDTAVARISDSCYSDRLLMSGIDAAVPAAVIDRINAGITGETVEGLEISLMD